jgi:hypothetical protein
VTKATKAKVTKASKGKGRAKTGKLHPSTNHLVLKRTLSHHHRCPHPTQRQRRPLPRCRHRASHRRVARPNDLARQCD